MWSQQSMIKHCVHIMKDKIKQQEKKTNKNTKPMNWERKLKTNLSILWVLGGAAPLLTEVYYCVWVGWCAVRWGGGGGERLMRPPVFSGSFRSVPSPLLKHPCWWRQKNPPLKAQTSKNKQALILCFHSWKVSTFSRNDCGTHCEGKSKPVSLSNFLFRDEMGWKV